MEHLYQYATAFHLSARYVLMRIFDADAFSRCTDVPVIILHNLDQTWTPEEIDEALSGVNALEAGLKDVGHSATIVPVEDSYLVEHLSSYNPKKHIVFNWCEEIPGLPHSDSQVADVLEEMGFTYTGSPASTLALSWDKYTVKCLLGKNGVPTPRWRVYRTPQVNGWECYPAIIKPAFEHCSLGVTTESVVMSPKKLQERIISILDVFRQPALVEDFIDGREFHVTLWGQGDLEMLPPVEMDFSTIADVRERLCTYDSKYLPDSPLFNQIELLLPAPLEKSEYELLKQTAVRAYRAVGCRDFARLDIRLRDGVFFVLDVNPNPDLCSETSSAYAAEVVGYSYGEMASCLIQLASLRHPSLCLNL